MTDDKQAILDALEDAGAVTGTDAFLSTAEISEATGLDEAQVEDLLTALRFGEDRTVAKGPYNRYQRLDDETAEGTVYGP